jgi:hypothetical protein
LALLFAGSEVVARSQIFKAHVIASDRGSAHDQFELQLGRLETIVAIEGGVDCIFLGNSMVWRGFDPEVFASAYSDQTGHSMRCFNFGVDGMPASSAGALASILIQDYRPQLLIYGTDARDYAVTAETRDAAVLLDTPWLRYRRGQFSPGGWLYEHIHFSRYRQSLGHLLRLEKTYLFVSSPRALNKDSYGFTADESVGSYVSSSPREHVDLRTVRYYFSVLSDYRILPENVRGLQEVASYNSPDTEVVIVEMPVPETYMDFFGNGEGDYQQFLSQVQTIAAAHDVPFQQTSALQLIPLDGWVDYSHLNTKGAGIFSRWLGEQLGTMTDRGLIARPIP